MKLRKILIFTVITVFVFVACSKSKDSTSSVVDYGSSASGTYTGIVQQEQLDGSVVISKQSNTTVNIDFTFTGGYPLHYSNVGVSNGGSGKINISLTTGTTPINGTINGKSLDCYFDQVHFIGTKP